MQDDWRVLVCNRLGQSDRANLARVDRAWNLAATNALYRRPDLSKCDESQLRAFLESVKGAKSRRRQVQKLDLIVPEKFRYEPNNPFVSGSQFEAGEELAYRSLGPLFEGLFSVFKNLTSIRVYGNGLTDSVRAHWRSLSHCLVELKIYNIGSLTDAGLLQIAERLSQSLQCLHLEHRNEASRSPRTLRIGTIDNLVKVLTKLRHLGIGVPLQNISNNKSFLEGLFDLETLCFIRVPNVDFLQLNLASSDCKWRFLTVHECPGMRPEDLDAVFRRLPLLESLDWRFPEDTFYDWTTCELKTAGCRRLKSLVLENGFFSDQCLMRILRVTSNLELLALSNCEEIHRIRSSSATHYVLKGLPSLMPIADALEECFLDMTALVFIEQNFSNVRTLASMIGEIFREAIGLQEVKFVECRIGRDTSGLEGFCRFVASLVTIERSGDGWLCLKANDDTPRRSAGRTIRNGIVPMSRYALCSGPNALSLTCNNSEPPMSAVHARDCMPTARTLVPHSTMSAIEHQRPCVETTDAVRRTRPTGLSPRLEQRVHEPASLDHENVQQERQLQTSQGCERSPEVDFSSRNIANTIVLHAFSTADTSDAYPGWGRQSAHHEWGTLHFELIERQKQTEYWDPINGKVADVFVPPKGPAEHHFRGSHRSRRLKSRDRKGGLMNGGSSTHSRLAICAGKAISPVQSRTESQSPPNRSASPQDALMMRSNASDTEQARKSVDSLERGFSNSDIQPRPTITRHSLLTTARARSDDTDSDSISSDDLRSRHRLVDAWRRHEVDLFDDVLEQVDFAPLTPIRFQSKSSEEEKQGEQGLSVVPDPAIGDWNLLDHATDLVCYPALLPDVLV